MDINYGNYPIKVVVLYDSVVDFFAKIKVRRQKGLRSQIIVKLIFNWVLKIVKILLLLSDEAKSCLLVKICVCAAVS